MEELSQIDRSTVARSLLKKVGIQKFLDMDGITEVDAHVTHYVSINYTLSV